MNSDPGPELSSMAAVLEDLGGRVTRMAEATVDTDDDWVAQELFEVERALTGAGRRLASVTRSLARQGPDRAGGAGPTRG